jgi:hypothetical protein
MTNAPTSLPTIGWRKRPAGDREILSIELQGLIDLGFEVELTGFEMPEIEMILDSASPPGGNTAVDVIPELAPNRAVTKPGDLWILGDHRLFCGDARRRDSFVTLLSSGVAQLVFVDPPYNTKIRGHVSGKGRVKHREFLQASGEKTIAQFTKFLEDSLGLLSLRVLGLAASRRNANGRPPHIP